MRIFDRSQHLRIHFKNISKDILYLCKKKHNIEKVTNASKERNPQVEVMDATEKESWQMLGMLSIGKKG